MAVQIVTDPDYPGYGIVWLGDVAVPVMVRRGKVVDCFTRGEGSVTGFVREADAWELIDRDYKSRRAS